MSCIFFQKGPFEKSSNPNCSGFFHQVFPQAPCAILDFDPRYKHGGFAAKLPAGTHSSRNQSRHTPGMEPARVLGNGQSSSKARIAKYWLIKEFCFLNDWMTQVVGRNQLFLVHSLPCCILVLSASFLLGLVDYGLNHASVWQTGKKQLEKTNWNRHEIYQIIWNHGYADPLGSFSRFWDAKVCCFCSSSDSVCATWQTWLKKIT